MTHYGDTINHLKTPQRDRARDDQAKNNAGGFVFEASIWTQLDRFLILGQQGPTYYASERVVVSNNAENLRRCLIADGPRVVRRIREISYAGRAPKNDPAVFALAFCAGWQDPEVRKLALEALPAVCRIGTDLFHFAKDVGGFRRWGRGLRRGIARWYIDRHIDNLALQAIKYQQRDGWGHRDLLRLAHPKAKGLEQDVVFRWMVGGKQALEAPTSKRSSPLPIERLPRLIEGFERAKMAISATEIAKLVTEYELPREAIPTEFLKDPDVWSALLPHMGLTALVRNLGRMTSLGLFKPFSSATKLVAARLTDGERLRKERVHPMKILLALGVYQRGRGDKGSLTWTPAREIVEALDVGFYQAFATVEPSGKNTLIALDVSGSMDAGEIAGAPGITPRIASAAMAMVTARSEPHWHVVGFTAPTGSLRGVYGGRWGGGSPGLSPIDLTKNERLDAVCEKVRRMPMGGTDCALPMIHALHERLEVDHFVVYTDNETWAGSIHPFQALRTYRQKMGRNARLSVVGMTATNFTIADPNDAGMLDVVGFDSHAPALLSSFAKGEV